jgi:hypothetical protein
VSGWGENFLHPVKGERIKSAGGGADIVLTQRLLFLTAKLREEQTETLAYIGYDCLLIDES